MGFHSLGCYGDGILPLLSEYITKWNIATSMRLANLLVGSRPVRAGLTAKSQKSVTFVSRKFGFSGEHILLLYLEGQLDLVSRIMMRIVRVTIWVIGYRVINLLPKSP